MNITNLIIFLLILVLVLTTMIILQIYLSKKKSKYFGLILPAITFIIAALYVIGSYSYNLKLSHNIISVIIGIVVWNIPTAILLIVYFTCREKLKRVSDIDRMKIEDL